MLKIAIGDRTLGEGCPVYVIAEAGSNHNGSLERALQLIEVAAEARADAVKFQLFKASRLYPASAGQSDYLGDPKSIYEIIREMEMPREWVPRLVDHCRACGIEFLCTPFDEDAADFLNSYVRAFKIASYEMTHTPLLRHVARFGKPIILSTGAADLPEVHAAVAAVRAEGNRDVVLLQCTASYPARLEALNVAAMGELRGSTGLLVGLSDHSRDPVIAPVVATALGAAVIEKHFTLSNALPGPDHGFAIEPNELKQMVAAIRGAEMVTGTALKHVLDDERELHQFARRSVFSTRAIAAGERLSSENVAVLRCGKRGFGIPPAAYPDVLGRTAARAIPPETPITADVLT